MTSDSQANLRRTWRIPTHFLQRFFLLGMMTVCVRSFRATTFRARSVPTKPKIHGTFPFDRRKYHAWKSSPFSSGATCSTTRIPSLMRRSMSQTNKEIMAATGYDKPKIRSKSDMQRIPAWQKELNPTQLEAVTKPVYSITRVVAGPGSGKTRVLTSRIAFLLNEDPKARILAVTFTRKAAGEMKQRLENLLKDADGNTPENRESTRQNYVSPENNHEQMIEEEYHGDGSGSSTYIRALSRVSLGTFHKICADILRYNGNYLASLPSVERDMVGRNATLLDGRFAIMDQSDQLRIMKECLAAANIDLKDAGGIKPLVVLNALSQLKDSINKGEDPFQTDSKQKKIPKQVEIAKKIYGIYRESMLSNNLLDFDDLIYLTRELLMENQEIRQQLHRRWTHILVDEYQDTSRAQIDLVRLWTSSSLLVVGDGDQSIYSWRGADPNSLSTFDEEFKGYLGDIETVHLTENYRSTANIVKAAQKVISSGEKSLAEKLRQNMKPKRGSGSTPRIVACADGKAEAKFVIKTILGQLDSGEYTPDTSVAILYRTNVQSRMLEEACVEHNLPYVILGKATSFYKRREVKDCLCFLRWLYNGRDKGSMLRAIQTPSRGLGDKAIQQFEEYCDLVDRAFESSDEAHRPTPLDILLSFTSPEEPGMPLRNETIATRPLKLFKEFARQMQSLHDLAHSEPVDKVLAAVIDTFDLISHFDKTSDSKAEFEERQSNVQELQQATRRYTQDGPCLQEEKISSTNGNSIDELDGAKSPLGAFLDDVALVADIGNNEDVDGKEGGSHNQKRFVVSLMTIHASKGMEFDSVFVVGCEDECFPTTQAIQAGKGSVALAEECRLCYVAMTRAKSNLFLTWRRESSVFAPNSANGFRFVNRNRSRFLDALVGGSKNKKDASAGNDVGTRSNDPNTKSVRRHNVPPYGTSQAYQPRSTTATATTSRRPTTQRSFSTTATRNNNQRVSSIPSSSRGYNSNNVISPRPNNRGGGSLSATQKALQRQRKGVPARVAETSPPRPSSTTSTSMPRRPATSASPRDSPSNGKQAATRRTSTAAAAASATMDSTWFYPVGSSVIHKKFGRGIVLNPPPATSPNDLPVRVKFEDGETRDVSSRGDELRPEI